MIGAIALVVFGMELDGHFSVEQKNDHALYALMTAILSISLALGGFSMGQYVKYKSRRLEFLKKVSDVLFFKSLDVGRGVLNALVDAAEEEECKEMILVFYLLLTHEKPMDALAVDTAAEAWLRREFDCEVDFDVSRALGNLAAIRGSGEKMPAAIVSKTQQGEFSAVTIQEAKL